MKYKLLSTFVTASVLAGSIIVPSASAQYIEGQANDETEGLEYKTLIVEEGDFQTISVEDSIVNQKFLQIDGVISKITKETSGYFFVTVEGENPFGFYYDENSMILNNLGEEITLKEGMMFTAFVDSNKPMTMIYPPRYSPDVIIAQTEEVGTAQLDQFDENYLNEKGDLVLNINEKTTITNLSGEKLTATDMINKQVIIFYEYVLESYPMQTGPSKVIVLEKSDEELAKAIADFDHYEVNGVTMIPLRLIAEQLGYKIEHNGNNIMLTKGPVSFLVTIGEKMYGYNKSLRSFKEAPALLEYGKTYVPIELLNQLVGKFE